MAKTVPAELPEVNFSEEGPVRHLHLGSEWIQGSMLVDAPHVLVHEYIQRMMAWLLFVDPETVARRTAVQLGLGAGSLTKFCARELHLKNTTAIELNPQVLHACRGWFRLPADNARMQVVLADAAQEIRQPRWQAAVDALQVDLYDEDAAAPVLDSEGFYADCRKVLSEDGTMTVNLFGHRSRFNQSVDKMAAAFGRDALWAFKPTREGNTVVLAQRTATRPPRATLAARAEVIKNQWGLPADKWLSALKPLMQ
jgi:spermidine synthase